MKPATHARACSASTSELRKQHEAVVAEPRGAGHAGEAGRRRDVGRAERGDRPRWRAAAAPRRSRLPATRGAARWTGASRQSAQRRACVSSQPWTSARRSARTLMPMHRPVRSRRLSRGRGTVWPVAPSDQRRDRRRRFDELGDLYELDGADRPPRHRLPQRRRSVRDAAVSVAALVARGPGDRAQRHRQDARHKLARPGRDGRHPAVAEAARQVPGGPDRGDAPAGLRAQARAAPLRRARDRLAGGAARRRRGRRRSAALRGFGAKVEEKLLEILAAGADGTPAAAHPARRARSGWPSRSSARCAHAPAADRVEIAGSAAAADGLGQGHRPDRDRRRPGARSCEALGRAAADRVRRLAGRQRRRARRTHTGMKVDLQVVEPDQFGNVLQHLTGSKAHNVAAARGGGAQGPARLPVRDPRRRDGRDASAARPRRRSTRRWATPWIPPELREGRGELEAARSTAARAARARHVEDLKGDLHCHTTLSDGRNTSSRWPQAAMDRGYEYLAITDHSASHGFGNDVTPDAAARADRAGPRAQRDSSTASSC